MTRAKLNERFNSFKARWLGRRTNIDGVYGYQCADLVKQYLKEVFGVPNGAYGNAIDYWDKPHPKVLDVAKKVSTKDVKKGDIVPLRGLGGNKYGHIGIATGRQTPSKVEILEQNGSTGGGSGLGADAVRTRYVSKSRMPGVLRPKTTKPPSSGNSKMPKVGSRIRLIPKSKRSTWREGTTKRAGTINVTDNTFVYEVRGYDKKYPYRIIINSRSAGGNGVALALYYTNGKLISGWKQL